MMKTEILIAGHGSGLVNSIFMPKRSVIIEILPYNVRKGFFSVSIQIFKKKKKKQFSSTWFQQIAIRKGQTIFQYHTEAPGNYTETDSREYIRVKDANLIVNENSVWEYLSSALRLAQLFNNRYIKTKGYIDF